MTVEIVSEVTPELVDQINHLIPQLSSSTPPLSAEFIESLVAQPDVHLFVYRATVDSPVIGMLSLALFRIPTGVRAWIEDVVVDAEARGQGAGAQLVEAAVAHAQYLGARTVDLTSRPSRAAANRLYQRCGFVARETNVYRYGN